MPDLLAPMEQVSCLLGKAGIDDGGAEVVERIKGGNNAIYRISVAGQNYALKKYAPADRDSRDRLGSEWNFLQCVREAGLVDAVPTPLSMDQSLGMALYSFVDGRRFSAGDVTPEMVAEAGAFITAINTESARKVGGGLGPASDVEFSIEGHADFLFRRLKRLAQAGSKEAAFRDLLSSVQATFEKARGQAFSRAIQHGIDVGACLAEEEKCLSPSDFGFHNALENRDGKLVFIDFEYAGWDDPAKLAADFVFQPQVPVADVYYDEFLENCLSHIGAACLQGHKYRAKLLKPLIGIRWCCIILNPFETGWAEERGCLADSEELWTLRRQRLESASGLLETINSMIISDAAGSQLD